MGARTGLFDSAVNKKSMFDTSISQQGMFHPTFAQEETPAPGGEDPVGTLVFRGKLIRGGLLKGGVLT